jgi:hypothetical protein
MPGPEDTPGSRGQAPARRPARPAVALAGMVLVQLPFASVFAGVVHHPAPHQAPVAVAGRSPLTLVVSGHGGGTVRLVAEPAASAARAASRAPQHAAQAAGTGAAASPPS